MTEVLPRGLNIFLSGPDDTGKSTTAKQVRDWFIDHKKTPAFVVPIPTVPAGLTFASGAIAWLRRGSVAFEPDELAMTFATDRLESAIHILRPMREKNPRIVFLFDRGPLDGAAYGRSLAPAGVNKRAYGRWLSNLDGRFNMLYPADIGLLFMNSYKAETERRENTKDTLDKNERLQREVRRTFPRLIRHNPIWNTIPAESDDLRSGRVFHMVTEVIEKKLITAN